MTYNVFSGTLNTAQSINQSINQSISQSTTLWWTATWSSWWRCYLGHFKNTCDDDDDDDIFVNVSLANTHLIASHVCVIQRLIWRSVHWPQMASICYVWYGDWAGWTWRDCSSTQYPSHCTKYHSPPIKGQCTNRYIAVYNDVPLQRKLPERDWVSK